MRKSAARFDEQRQARGSGRFERLAYMNDFVLPVTRYALSDDVNIAYQTLGDGPIDLIIVPGIISHTDFFHEFAGYTAFLRRLSKFARVITFDKQGQGLSDRISGAPSSSRTETEDSNASSYSSSLGTLDNSLRRASMGTSP